MRPIRRTTTGLTLVEILVGLALLSTLLALVAFAFKRTAELTSRESALLELQQSTHFIAQSVEDDLQTSGVSGVSYFSRSDTPYEGCAVSRISDITNEGNLVWENDKTVYYWESNTQQLYKALLRKGGLAKLPAPMIPSELSSLPSSSLEMANSVTEFSVTNDRADGSGRLVQLSLERESEPSNSSRHRTYRIDKTIALKN